MIDQRFSHISSLVEFMDEADYVDIKSADSTVSLREYVAGILGYQPAWMRMLWHVRVWLLTSLGQGKQIMPEKKRFTVESIPMTPGVTADFFTVVETDKETFWVAEGKEKHLDAIIGVVAEETDPASKSRRFHVITVVKYNNAVGPVYFNIIRPFHHLVVVNAMKAIA